MGVDGLLLWRPVELQEALGDELGTLIKVRAAGVLREAHREVDLLDLLPEEIGLVQEENDGGVGEPPGVADGVKQLKSLLHAVLLFCKWQSKSSLESAFSFALCSQEEEKGEERRGEEV